MKKTLIQKLEDLKALAMVPGTSPERMKELCREGSALVAERIHVNDLVHKARLAEINKKGGI